MQSNGKTKWIGLKDKHKEDRDRFYIPLCVLMLCVDWRCKAWASPPLSPVIFLLFLNTWDDLLDRPTVLYTNQAWLGALQVHFPLNNSNKSFQSASCSTDDGGVVRHVLYLYKGALSLWPWDAVTWLLNQMGLPFQHYWPKYYTVMLTINRLPYSAGSKYS